MKNPSSSTPLGHHVEKSTTISWLLPSSLVKRHERNDNQICSHTALRCSYETNITMHNKAKLAIGQRQTFTLTDQFNLKYWVKNTL